MDLLFPEPRCIESLGESFSDYEIVCKIAERLGLLEEYTGGRTHPRDHQAGLRDLRVGRQDQLGGVATRRATTSSRPTPIGRRSPPASSSSTRIPERHPLSTPTGKLEFYSTGLAEHFPDDDERPPVPKWIPKACPTRRPSGPSGARSIRCWS